MAQSVVATADATQWRAQLFRGHVERVLEDARRRLADGDSGARLQLALALQADGRHAAALLEMDAAIEATATAKAAALLELLDAKARSLYLLGKREDARSAWESVLHSFESNPELDAVTLTAVGRAAAALGRWESSMFRRALLVYEQALEKAPTSLSIQVELANLLLDKYNSAEAVALLGEVLSDKDNPFPAALMALARAQAFDRSNTARQTLAGLLELDPQYVPALVLRAKLNMEAERYDTATADVREALAIHPRHQGALAVQAALGFLLGDQEGFEPAVIAVREMAPGSGDLFLELARTAARNRRYAQAVQFALGAVSVERRNWQAYVVLGVNRMRQGQMEAGRSALEIGFKGDPYNIWAKNTLDLLDKMDGFEQKRSEHFILAAPAAEAPILAPHLLPIAEAAYEAFAQRYDHRPTAPIRIELFANHEDFSVRTAGVVGLGILGVSFGPVVALDSPSAGAFGPVNWASVVWHEVAHSFHLSLSNHQAPRWFSEGLAVYEEQLARTGWGADVSPDFLRAYVDGRLPPPSRLNSAFLRPSYPQQIIHGYFLAALLIEFISDKHGFDVINQMLRGFARRESIDDLVQRLMTISLAELDQEFDAYFRVRFAAALHGVTPSDSAPQGGYARHLEAGLKALHADKFAVAERELLLANAQFPEHGGSGSSHDLLSRLAAKRGAYGLGARWLQKSIDIDADDLDGHLRLAQLLERSRDQEGALDVLRRSILIDPFNASVHRKVAEFYSAREQWSKAVDSRVAVTKLNPDDPVVASEELARTYMMSGDLAAARIALLGALERAPMYERGLDLLLELRARAEGAPIDNRTRRP
jgi:cellulose synthase operon protein C